jgi:2-dehydro-3-deoxygalactonokinase
MNDTAPDAPTPTLLGIDWGTSNRRAWWLGAAGEVLAEHSDDQGLLAAQGRFAEALRDLRQAGPALHEHSVVLMSGMVGAASGWQEAPYMDAALPLTQLARQLQPLAAAGPRCFIVPGVCFVAADGTVDVMRGEETQLLGALALGHGDGWYVLPGTHSKWVRLQGGRVADLATYMTGELFALLTQHGTLSSVTREAATDVHRSSSSNNNNNNNNNVEPAHPQAFARGFAAAQRSGLSNALFGCRAQVVAGRMPAAEAREYLSGLLIGAEWHDVVRRAGRAPTSVTLIGSASLAQRYGRVAEAAGCRITTLDARSVQLAALAALRAGLGATF